MFFVMLFFAFAFLLLSLMWLAQPEQVKEPAAAPAGDIHQVAWSIAGPSRVLMLWWTLLRQRGVIQEAGTDPKTKRPLWSFHPQGVFASDPWLTQAAARLPSTAALQSDIAWLWQQDLHRLESSLRTQKILSSAGYALRRRFQVLIATIACAGVATVLMLSDVPYAWLLLGVAVLTLLLMSLFGEESSPRLSTWGRTLRQRWAQQHISATRAPQESSLGFAVAVGGLAVLAGTPFAAYADSFSAKAEGASGGCGSGAAAGSSGGCGSVGGAGTAAGGGFASGGGFGGGDAASGGDGGGGSGCGGGGCGGGGCGG